MLYFQALAHFGRHYNYAEEGATLSTKEDVEAEDGAISEAYDAESSLPCIAAMRLTESNTANRGLVCKG